MASCWRCGVEFDDTDYLQGAPCPDCQLDDPTIEYRKLNVVTAAEAVRRDQLVRAGWEDLQSDPDIAAAIGLSARQVLRVRAELGLPGHVFNGKKSWKDLEAIRKKQSDSAKAYWADPERVAQRKKRKGERTGVLAAKGDNHGWS